MVDRSILVVALNGFVLGVHRQTGEIRWKQGTDGSGGGARTVVFVAIGYGFVIASGGDNVILALDYMTGEIRWSAETTKPGRATILVERDLIVCAKSGYLDCFDHGGKKLWSQPLTGYGLWGVALGFPDNVAQADSNRI
jgi:outer membrane protein assembly factor BamB